MSEIELKVMRKVGEWLAKLPVTARFRVLRFLLESMQEELQQFAREESAAAHPKEN